MSQSAQAQAHAQTEDDYAAAGHTPMMAQYLALKSQYADYMLFYRMGDFFELFFDDAIKASEALDITLTKRGKTAGDEIPMCGVPAHAYESYLARLIRLGFKVAICDQVETPEQAKKRGGSKALVRRDVIRLVTQGTLTEETLLDARENNYLCALTEVAGQYGLSWMDLSTGVFMVQPICESGINAAIERIGASEILIPDRMVEKETLFETFALIRDRLTIQPSSLFDSENARKRLENMFDVGTLESFGNFTRAEIAAAGGLVDYAQRTQMGRLPRLSQLRQVHQSGLMEIDSATRRNLELIRTQTGERKGSLLSVIDRTVTAAGARELQSRLSAPLCDRAALTHRLDEVSAFVAQSDLRAALRNLLKHMPDMERALSRLTLGRGSPRDLGQIRDGLRVGEDLRALLIATPHPALDHIAAGMVQPPALQSLADRLMHCLRDELPALSRDGGFVREGYSPKLDELRNLRENSRRMMAALEARYKTDTAIESLKISYNNILGYFVEVPAKRADKLMVLPGQDNRSDNPFIHRQTMASAVRFTTAELAQMERDISSSSEKSIAIELELFDQLCADIESLSNIITTIARAIANLDTASALADLAVTSHYTRPVLTDGLDFSIEGGRHPVVEWALRAGNGTFIPNHCDLNPGNRLWLLTGPNMAGKSTYLRQNALIVLLAQMGSFVPAQSATIGLVDRLFSRVGASDDLARGHSTFMVEMVETAAILNQATEKSLVILDEIGRGTATFDGLSIAWACVEHLHAVNKSRALFATHYHELTKLTEKLDNLSCHAMQVKEWEGDIIFLHAIGPGAADHSYGIHVARLAGLPDAVISRARSALDLLQKSEQSGALAKLSDDLPLFNAAPAPRPETQKQSAVLEKLRATDPDTLTPREALDILYSLKSLDNTAPKA